jgi:protein phosphatase
LLGGLILLAAIAVAVGGYFWTQTQYFVGRDGTEVALFRGVNAEFGPLSFYSVVENSDLKIADLQPAARSQVNNGITARSRTDGRQILTRLSKQLLPLCSEVSASPSSSPTTTPAPTHTTTSPKKPAPTPARSTAHAAASHAPTSRAVTTPHSTAPPTPTSTGPAATTTSPTPTDACR